MTLTIDQLDVQYGRRTVVREATLTVEPGKVTSIVGPNGAGKSTLLKCVAGLINPASGHIRLADEDITTMPAERVVRAGIALVPEGKHVFSSLSVEENMRLAATSFGKANRGTRIADCLDLFPGLRTRMSQRACSLSGGEQQQLMIARSLVGSPTFVLLDEPSTGLAPRIVHEVFGILRSLTKRGVGVLLVEQFVQQAVSISDDVYLLTRGRLGPKMSAAEARQAIDQGTFFEAYSGRGATAAVLPARADAAGEV